MNLAQQNKKNLIQFKRKFMFLDSVIQHDAEEVQRLLALGVDVNYTNTDGISALHQVSPYLNICFFLSNLFI